MAKGTAGMPTVALITNHAIFSQTMHGSCSSRYPCSCFGRCIASKRGGLSTMPFAISRRSLRSWCVESHFSARHVQADLAFPESYEVRAVRTAGVFRSLPRWVPRGLLDVPRRSAGADLGGGGSNARTGRTKMGRWLTRVYILGW